MAQTGGCYTAVAVSITVAPFIAKHMLDILVKKRIKMEKQVVRLPVIGGSRRVGLLQTWSAFSCWAHHHHSTRPLHLVLLRSALAVTEAQHAVAADLVPGVRIVPGALLGGQGSKVDHPPLGHQPTTSSFNLNLSQKSISSHSIGFVFSTQHSACVMHAQMMVAFTRGGKDKHFPGSRDY